MNQYLKLLCSCQILQPVRNDVFIAPKGTSEHVVVAYKNEVILHIIVIKCVIIVQNGKTIVEIYSSEKCTILMILHSNNVGF